MPYGIIINCVIGALGGVLGSLAKNLIPKNVSNCLSQLFGITSITIGITLIVKIHTLPAVMLALLLGATIGELLHLEDGLRALFLKLKPLIEKLLRGGSSFTDADELIGVCVLVCTGSTGLLGAMTEGMTGEPGILIAKSVLDFFGCAIFATTIGGIVAFIAFPQLVIYLSLYCCAQFILPFTTPDMISDFVACGGIIALVTGLRIAKIKSFNVTNLIPALIIVMPLSHLWTILPF